jgi:hypothetical protein
MADIRGFIIGRLIAEQAKVDEDEQTRVGLLAALMPTPLLGAVVATVVVRDEESTDGDDARGGAVGALLGAGRAAPGTAAEGGAPARPAADDEGDGEAPAPRRPEEAVEASSRTKTTPRRG